MNEPVADAVRAILDGHVVLTRELAHASHYPAVDVLASVSRLIGDIAPTEVRAAGQQLRAALAAYREKEDLIAIGAYQRGNNPIVDATIAMRESIENYLCQAVEEPSTLADADAGLLALAQGLGGARGFELESGLDDLVDETAIDVSAGTTPPIPTLLLNP
jgi:flagellum-specific ATP synthase